MQGSQYGQEMMEGNENSGENCDEILEDEDDQMMGEEDDRERSPQADMDAQLARKESTPTILFQTKRKQKSDHKHKDLNSSNHDAPTPGNATGQIFMIEYVRERKLQKKQANDVFELCRDRVQD